MQQTKRFLVCGVPRSGTTIVAKLLDHLPGHICLHEPVQTLMKYGEIRVKNGSVSSLDLSSLLLSLDAIYDRVGAKEPFATMPGYLIANNTSFLQEWRNDPEVQKVWVVRNPLEVFKSQYSWADPYKDVKKFLTNYQDFLGFMKGEWFIHYQGLMEDPLAELRQFVPDLTRLPTLKTERIKPTSTFMGDHRAMHTIALAMREQKNRIPLKFQKQIINSAAMHHYQALCQERRLPR